MISGANKLSSLPNDVTQLKELILDLQEKQKQQESVIHTLWEEVALLKRLKYVRTSEKWTPEDKQQMVLFNEAEETATTIEGPESSPEQEEIKTYPRRKAGRKPLPADIPREEIIYELPAEERACPCCGNDRLEIGREESEELQFIPAKIIVKKHVRLKYGPCKCEEFQNDETLPVILKAPVPPRLIPGSIASSGLLSYILVSKFCDALPFCRMERIFRRLDIEISRSNMSNWAIKAALACEPLIELMRQKTREGPLINMDETTVQVLKEPGRKPENKSFMWVTVGSDQNRKIVLFNYSQTRREEIPLSLLDGFKGVLQTDGYVGYNRASKEYKLYHVGCLAHARRKFFEAAAITKGEGNADKALKIIQKIYQAEKTLRAEHLDDELFVAERRKQVIPLWQEFHQLLKKWEISIPPKTKLGEAVNYTLNEYKKLVRYLKYVYVTPDNNLAENSIRPFVIGRKNWIFFDTPKGAHASAVLYSLIETAKANQLEPQDYLYHLFEMLPLIELDDQSDMEALLPWNIHI